MKMNLAAGSGRSLFRRSVKKGAYIGAGSVIQGFGMGVFLFPHSVPAGGCAGLAVLLKHWIDLPLSIGLWATNIIFLLFAVHYLGSISAIGTIMVITVTAVSVNFFEVYASTPFSNEWMNLLAGSLFLGLGICLLLMQRLTNGGIGFVALAIARHKKMNPGTTLFWFNGIIFLITAYIIDWKIVIQALICQWISTRLVVWLYPFLITLRNPVYCLAWRKK